MRYLSLENLTEDMVIAQNIKDEYGRVLITEGSKITEQKKKKLENFGIAGVYIDDAWSADIFIQPTVDETLAKNSMKALQEMNLDAVGDCAAQIVDKLMGADDYISKPFRPRELVSRIRSVLRRSGKRQSVITLGDLTVDTNKGTVFRDGQELYLSALEYKLLLVFLNYRGQILTRDKLLEEIWDSAGDYVSDNTLTVYIKRLREKIEPDPQEPTIIKTVRGIGYRLEG